MSELHEKVGKLQGDVKALHERLDRQERQTLASLGEIGKDVKSLLAFRNKVAGMMAAATLIGTFLGWAISLFIKH